MPENILIVEDKIIVARDLQQLVEGYGYNVIAIASSGAEAYSIAVERRPDLILMDIMLGEGDDGIETALKIKDKLDVAIVYASAYSNSETLMRAGKSEPYGYILKPFNEREINTTIQMALYKHKAEKIIRESEKHYRNLFQSIPDAIFVWEISHEEPRVSKFIDVNDIACSLLSYGKTELLKMSFLDIMVSERFKDIDDHAERLLKERHYSRETVVLDRHGRKIPVELSCSVNDFNGKTQVISIMRDIREIKKAQTTILEGEARYKNLVETIPNGLIELDNSASVLYANTSLCSMLGRSYDEIISRHAWEFIYKDDQDYFQKFFLSMLKGDKKPEPLIIKCVKKDGAIIDVQADWNYKLDELGRVVGFISVITDITEKIKITGELKNAKAMAEEANKAKSEFLANMSHEIRTPMNGIIGMSHLMFNTDLDAVQREYLEMIKLSSDNLLSLINDILDFSKIEAKKLELEKIDFLLRDSVEHTVKVLMYKAMQKGIKVYISVNPAVPNSLLGDPGRFRQIISNLLSNAIKFTQRGEINIKADLEAKSDKRVTLHFCVSDTGIGIPAEKQTKIFDAFTQADSSITRKYEGTGLGLTITKQLIELMGGKIWVESEVGRGSSFHFLADFEISSANRRVALADFEILKSKRVLIVDDNFTNRKILDETLKNWHMNPELASSATEAFKLIERSINEGRLYDIMLLDVNMPEMDGWEFASRVRQIRELKNVKIIIMPSAGLRGDIEHSVKLGISAYLIKPVVVSELEEAILMIIDEKQNDSRQLITQHSIRENKQRLNILLAEDEIVNQKIASKLLELHGHAVTIVSDGLAAFESYKKDSYDMIFMDVQMPEMDGIEATAKIRECEAGSGKRIPIVAMTAFAMKGDRDKCFEAGMDAYISKPIEIEEIFKVINNLFSSFSSDKNMLKPNYEKYSRPAFDEKMFLAGQKNDLVFSIELVNLFLDNVSGYMNEIRSSIEAYDPRSLKKAAHMLKGSVKNFHALNASEAAHAIELLAMSENFGGVDDAFKRLENEIERLKKDMRSFLEKNKN